MVEHRDHNNHLGLALDKMQDFYKFSDPRAEGPFSTTASRCVADTYIQGQIKGHESITRYYKRCRNALTITCRIPPEILSAIFGEVVRCAEIQATISNDLMSVGHMDWIPSISHVCGHWREVALAAPNLWSNIPVNNPPWALEMVKRANPVPLTIRYRGPMSLGSIEEWTPPYRTLREILRFHLPRIKSLTLDSWPTSGFDTHLEHNSTSSESTGVLSMLNQPAPMIERLEVRLLRSPIKIKLPYELFTMSSRLRHLVLEDCGMEWDSKLIDFGNLRSLELSNLPQVTNPSLYQLLAILRRTSRLESLNLEKRDNLTGLVDSSMLHGNDAVALRHLERITLIGDLSYCVLLNHIIFSQNAYSINLRIRDIQDILNLLAPELAEKFNDGIEGSIVSLSLDSHTIRCWKSKDTTQIPSFHSTPTIHISSYNAGLIKGEDFLRALRLDQLVSLEIGNSLEEDSWTFFGNLPKLRDLCVRTVPHRFFDVLHRGLIDAQPIHMTFPALRNLTMRQCFFGRPTLVDHNTDDHQSINVVQLMLSCFELRKKAGLSLDSLRLQNCIGVEGIQLERLRVLINRVEWIGYNDDFNDEDFKYFDYDVPGYDGEEMDEDSEPYIHDDHDYDDYDYDDYFSSS